MLTMTTHTLELRPIADDDLPALHGLFTDPDVRRHLWDDEIVSISQTRDVIEANMRLWRDESRGIWGLRFKGREDLIGFAGLWYFRSPPSLELLFGVAPAQWRRGVATEAASAVLGYAFESLQLSRLTASTDTANVASIRVLEKLGMQRLETRTVEGLETVFFQIEAGAWRGALGPAPDAR